MLDRAHRMRRSQDFHDAVRSGSRAGCATLVVHVTSAVAHGQEAQIGFIVSKSVGTAVVRNRVRRRLRHLARPRVEAVPPGSRVVVRALPPAATVPTDQLTADLESCLRRALLKAERATSP